MEGQNLLVKPGDLVWIFYDYQRGIVPGLYLSEGEILFEGKIYHTFSSVFETKEQCEEYHRFGRNTLKDITLRIKL